MSSVASHHVTSSAIKCWRLRATTETRHVVPEEPHRKPQKRSSCSNIWETLCEKTTHTTSSFIHGPRVRFGLDFIETGSGSDLSFTATRLYNALALGKSPCWGEEKKKLFFLTPNYAHIVIAILSRSKLFWSLRMTNKFGYFELCLGCIVSNRK